jgi:hypothetical protein
MCASWLAAYLHGYSARREEATMADARGGRRRLLLLEEEEAEEESKSGQGAFLGAF